MTFVNCVGVEGCGLSQVVFDARHTVPRALHVSANYEEVGEGSLGEKADF
jgi:hypothetical protein